MISRVIFVDVEDIKKKYDGAVSSQKRERETSRGVVAYVLDDGIVVSEFELQSRYHVYFWTYNFGKGMNPLLFLIYGLNNAASILQGWL